MVSHCNGCRAGQRRFKIVTGVHFHNIQLLEVIWDRYLQKSTMSHVFPLLSHYSQCDGTRLKMALVTFENRPNFLAALLELWGSDSDQF